MEIHRVALLFRCFQIELEFSLNVFVERGKAENWSKDENQKQTQPTYDAGSEIRTWATSVGGERSHNCAIHAPQMELYAVKTDSISVVN